MSVTEKISVAMGREELRLAKTAARQAGVSLSAYVTGAVRERLIEERRREAALEVLATFQPEDLPSPKRERQLLELWSSPAPRAAAKPASAKRSTRAGPRRTSSQRRSRLRQREGADGLIDPA